MIKCHTRSDINEPMANRAGRSSNRRAITAFLGVVAVLGWAYFFFFSEIFTVQAIEIEGVQRLKRGEVERIMYDIVDQGRVWPFRARNIFVLNADEVAKQLKNELYVEGVAVDKQYPNILRLKLEERQTTIIVMLQESAFEVDRHGIITREVGADELRSIASSASSSDRPGSVIPVLSITSASGSLPMVDDEFAAESQVARWLDTFDTLKKRGFGYRSASIELKDSTKLKIDMHESYDVYFDMLSSMEAQIEGFYAFMKAKNADQTVREYIDARIPGKIYFK